MRDKQGYVYIMTNKMNTVLYTGVTSDLSKRIWEHKHNINQGSFTAHYKIHKLVYYEVFETIVEAIDREKRIKGGSRRKKLELIRSINPSFKDLLQ